MAAPSIVAAGLSKRFRSNSTPDGWLDALRDVSFEIGAGEGVGLIGRNGAGKSTLLKILSRVTRPSAGYADVYGTVGALLEVGTGFHPELTGRENVYLSGAVLGMSQSEVKTRFDEIVAFAEMESFIDTPVKRYSSGMYARLGFAVAAHLRPSILIVDEVLAVGDLPFQAKCLARMHQLTSDGTTVLFVSHNLLGLSDLCPRSLVISAGSLVYDGLTPDAIGAYKRLLIPQSPHGRSIVRDGLPTHRMRVNGMTSSEVRVQKNGPIHIDLEVESVMSSAVEDFELNLMIDTLDGHTAVHLRNDLAGIQLRLEPGINQYEIEIPDLPLAPGIYSLWMRMVNLHRGQPSIWDTERITVLVDGDQRLGSIALPRHRFAQRRGPVSVGSRRLSDSAET